MESTTSVVTRIKSSSISGKGSMAALSSVSLHKSLVGFRRSNCKAKIPATSVSGIVANSLFHSQFRCGNSLRSGMRQRLSTVCASDNNPSAGDSLKNKAEKSEASQGPPVLTILAGFVVFFIICWIVGSIVMWLIGLIVNVPKSK